MTANPKLLPVPNPSPATLRQLIRARGWRMADLAWWLGLGRTTLYQALNDPTRDAVWSLALLNLPTVTPAQLRALRAARLARREAVLPPLAPAPALQPGDELVALRHLGELVDEGEAGVILALEQGPDGLHYRLRFAGGDDDFSQAQLLRDFAETGRQRPLPEAP